MNGHIFRMQLFREPNTNDATLNFLQILRFEKKFHFEEEKMEKEFEWIYGHE